VIVIVPLCIATVSNPLGVVGAVVKGLKTASPERGCHGVRTSDWEFPDKAISRESEKLQVGGEGAAAMTKANPTGLTDRSRAALLRALD